MKRSEGSMAGVPKIIGVDFSGKKILDVGCGEGKDLTDPAYALSASRWGIDRDERAIERGRKLYPGLHLVAGRAEVLPFPDEHFDVVTARVSLPYTDIPKTLKEIARVMRPGGQLLITLHDWRLHLIFFGEAFRAKDLKRLVDLVYVTGASLVYALFGKILVKPWARDRRETFQCSFRARRDLASAGFAAISEERRGRYFVMRALRAEADQRVMS